MNAESRAARVDCAAGTFIGTAEGGAQRFLGIPFARAPLGSDRFLAPCAPPRQQQPQRADTPRPAAMQNRGNMLGTRPVGATSEDCLHLNITTPDPSARLPVMVWLHGGGFINGSANDPLHTGFRLVTQGRVVLVTLDYRLGLFGFLHLPGHENAGLRDQIAALRWVAENVAAFGGDPDRVTLFGESAGAMSIAALCASPEADPLFHRMILQSIARPGWRPSTFASTLRRALAAETGTDDVEHWQAMEADTLVTHQRHLARSLRIRHGGNVFRPIVDESLVQQPPMDALAAGRNRIRPMLIGMNTDEQRLYTNLRHDLSLEDAAHRLGRAVSAFAPDASDDTAAATARAAEILNAYTTSGTASSRAFDLALAETDVYYRMELHGLVAHHNVGGAGTWAYEFTWPSPALRGRLGACHALEIPFVFGTLDAPGMARFAGTGPAAERLSERMIDVWAAFAHHGDPREAASDLDNWRPAMGGEVTTWCAGAESRVCPAPGSDRLTIWRELAGIVPREPTRAPEGHR